jgi:hypothetical protein
VDRLEPHHVAELAVMTYPQDFSTAAQIYVELWLKLDQLGLDGKHESQEADDLRDRMDTPWYDLTEDDVVAVERFFKERRDGSH